MESTSNRQPITANQPTAPVLYSAVAWVAGTYTPGKNKRAPGVIVTPDDEAITARLHWHSRSQLKKLKREATEENPKLQQYRFKVYPRTNPRSTTNPLSFDVMAIKPLQPKSRKRSRHEKLAPLDEFRVVGEIMKNCDNRVTVCVRRNEQPPVGQENQFCYKPLYLKMDGGLASAALGEIWELKVRRMGTKLVVENGHRYRPSKDDLAYLQLLAKQNAASASLASQSLASAAKLSDTRVEVDTSLAVSQRKLKTTMADTKTQQHQQQKPGAIPTADTTTQKNGGSAQVAATQRKAQSTNSRQSATTNTKAIEKNQPQQQQLKSQKKPAFQVKVNDRVFSGYDSVTLNRRLVCIDGKPVAQAKMVVVLGQPAAMQADGGVTSGRHQAVLTSR